MKEDEGRFESKIRNGGKPCDRVGVQRSLPSNLYVTRL